VRHRHDSGGEDAVGRRHRAFAFAQWQVVDDDAVRRALDSTRSIPKSGRQDPQRDKEPGPQLRVVVAGRRLAAVTAFGADVAAGRHGDFNPSHSPISVATQPDAGGGEVGGFVMMAKVLSGSQPVAA
jgi:hypothetical protein